MTKTLWSEKERTSNFEIPSYIKVTATKIDEIEAGVQNLYRDEQGNEYIVKFNSFKRRDEFVKIR
jgi:hypothetical protein